MQVKINNRGCSSKFIADPYFPAQIDFGFSPDNPFHLLWVYYGDDNLLHFSCDQDSGELLEMVLEDCEHFSIDKSLITIPDASDGTLVLADCKVENHPGYFQTHVHLDGFIILFSKKKAARYIKSGQVYFGLSADNELLEIRVTDLSSAEIIHVMETLEIDRIERNAS